MRALSLTQPWATLVAVGAKKIETRSWRTDYRGDIAIHAAKGFPAWARDYCTDANFRNALWPDLLGRADAFTVARERLKLLPLGQLVAVARLAHVMPTTAAPTLPMGYNNTVYQRPALSSDEYAFGDYSPNRFMWFLEDARELPKPIPCRGALSLWEVPDEAMRQIAMVDPSVELTDAMVDAYLAEHADDPVDPELQKRVARRVEEILQGS